MTSILSTNNSYDYRKIYPTEAISIPYTGSYEAVDKYSSIHIYANSSKNDTLRIEFLNTRIAGIATDSEYTTYQEYSINNTSRNIILTPSMKYFRIKITSNDTFSSSDLRIYNVFYMYNQSLNTDASGSIIISNASPLNINTTFSSTNLDAFGRLRVSNPFTLFDSTNIYNKNTKFSEYISGGGSITYNANKSSVLLNATNTSRVIRESKNIFCYQPGKSLLIMCSFVMDTASPTLSQRIGYYNSDNGIFLDLSGSNLYICKRTSISGSVENVYIQQANWNTNTLTSSTVLDITKAQIFWIDIEWLGVGSVRTGFIIDGQFIICHIFNNANILNSVYMTSANLPIRYELNKTSTGSATLTQICSTVISEGGYESTSIIRHIGTSYHLISLGNAGIETPVIAIRLRSAKINSIVIPCELSAVVPTNGTVYYRILLNPTITVSQWTQYVDYSGDVISNSAVEYALSANLSNMSKGSILNAGYINQQNLLALASRNDFNLQLGRNINSSTPDTTSTYTSDIIVISFIGVTNSQTVAATLGWFET